MRAHHLLVVLFHVAKELAKRAAALRAHYLYFRHDE
jgi:hypothetical protein